MLSSKHVLGLGAGALLAGVAYAQMPEKPAIAPTETADVAANIVTESAGIRRGELVLISGGTRDQQLLEDIAVQVRKLGAFPVITIGSDRLVKMLFTEVDPRFDSQEQAFMMRLAEIIDAKISVEFSQQPDLLAGVPPERLTARSKAFEPIEKKMLERGVISCHLGNGLYPSEPLAKQFGISYDQLSKVFWNGINVDLEALQSTGERVTNLLAAGREVHITAPNGTDLTVEITKRPVFVSDGIISEEERYAKGPACQVWLPAGEVYVTPVPGTARGTFVADTYFYEGKLIEGLKLEFAKGKLTSMTAGKGDISALRKRYDAAPAGKDLFAAIDLGINPEIKIPSGSRMVTWMAAGTISVGIGGNIWAGGDNAVPYGLFAHLPNGTMTIDGKVLVQNGKLHAP